MTECPHCGAALPSVPDAFCPICRESLDEPILRQRTPAQKAALRADGKRQFWAALIGVLIFIKVIYWILRFMGGAANGLPYLAN